MNRDARDARYGVRGSRGSYVEINRGTYIVDWLYVF